MQITRLILNLPPGAQLRNALDQRGVTYGR